MVQLHLLFSMVWLYLLSPQWCGSTSLSSQGCHSCGDRPHSSKMVPLAPRKFLSPSDSPSLLNDAAAPFSYLSMVQLHLSFPSQWCGCTFFYSQGCHSCEIPLPFSMVRLHLFFPSQWCYYTSLTF